MALEYSHVEERDGRFYVRGSRIPVATLAHLWNEGVSPEIIRQRFPSLRLVEVYGAITFYLDHKEVIDQYEVEDNAAFDAARAAQHAADPERYANLQRRFAARKAHGEASAS
jgi:uncharacterized protein (DUF433 family)